jgi:hypothetical protein
MATIAHPPVTHVRRRMLVVGVTSLLLGGVAGGLAGNALQTGSTTAASLESAPSVQSGSVHNVEAIRARNYAPAAPVPQRYIDAIRAQNYRTGTTTTSRDIDAVRARNHSGGGGGQ